MDVKGGKEGGGGGGGESRGFHWTLREGESPGVASGR